MLKKLLTGICLLLLPTVNSLKAQDDPNCGYIFDGLKVDSITCWNFKEGWIVFPVNASWKDYDMITARVMGAWLSKDGVTWWDENAYPTDYVVSKNEFFTFYKDGDYSAMRLAKNGKNIMRGFGFYIKRRENPKDYYKKDREEAMQNDPAKRPQGLRFELRGFMITGYKENLNNYGNGTVKTPIYDKGTMLYKTKWLPYRHCTSLWVKNKDVYDSCALDASSCKLIGNKYTNIITESNTNENFGLVKTISVQGNGNLNSSGNCNVSKDNSKAVIKNGSQKSNASKTNGNNATTKADAQGKSDLTMYLEKWDNGKVKIQGQKDKDDQLQGTWKYYDETGKLEKTEEWKDNELLSTKDN